MKTIWKATLMLVVVALVSQSFRSSSFEAPPGLKFPKKVDAVIKDKCYGCHSAEGKGDKAKAALMWDDLAGMDGAMRAEKLKKISKVLSEGSMPPKMMLEKMPEKKLSETETALLSKWASKATSKAMK